MALILGETSRWLFLSMNQSQNSALSYALDVGISFK
jgi:hypothetical protein